MAFPATPLPQKHEILINGAWTDVTSYVRGQTGRDGVTITRGYSGEQSQLSPGSVALALNNRDNRFSNRNPTGPYYRQLGRNTQYRASIDTGVVFAKFNDASTIGTSTYDGSTIWTADKASLDITGDIDITVDVDADDWRGRRGHILAAKFIRTGNQRSWIFGINPDGYLYFDWSTDGSAVGSIRAPLPVWPTGRIALRVLFDVDNGSGGYSAGFFTAPTLLGATTQIGSTVVTTAGTTSIFSSSARVELGTFDNGSDRANISPSLGDFDPFCGRMYGFRLRSGFGVGGTDVAVMDATTRTAGTTSWSDGLTSPNTWNVTGSTYLTSYDIRFWGELPSLPRVADTSATDLYVNARAADIIQRLTQGNNSKPLRSAVFRNLSQYAWDGYWPMEDSFVSGSGFAAYAGQPGYQTSGSFSGSSPNGFAGSAGSMSFSDDTGYASGNAAMSSGSPTVATVLCYFKFNTPPTSTTTYPFMNWYLAGGNAYRLTFGINSTTFTFQVIDVYGNSLASVSVGYGTGVSVGSWLTMRAKFSASGGTVTVEPAWYSIGSGFIVGTSMSYTGTMPRPTSWISWPFPGKSGMELAHVAIGRFDVGFTGLDFIQSTNAYNGESWPARARRLAAEQNQQLYIQGATIRDSSTAFIKNMGPQSPKSFIDLLKECADVAGGTLFAPRDKFGLTIRSWEAMADQAGGSQPLLDYSAGALSGTLSPNPDDFLVENDVTLTQPDGQSFRYAKTTGSLNTQDPLANADAIGTYDVADTTNTYSPADLAAQVYRRVLFGTWDEDRYSGVQVNLERALYLASATLTGQVRKLDLGRAFSITNPGAWLAVNQIDLMTTGYTETLGQLQHQFVFNTRPAGPWNTGIWGSSTFATTSLWGPASTTLNTALTTTATSVVITTPDVYELWTYVSNYLIEIAGERMTVTACSARSGSGPYTYTLTVIRSVNGVVKTISAGETVTLPAVGRWG